MGISSFRSFFKISFSIIILTIVLNGCASKGTPGGGPIDKTPPEIFKTFPAPDSINVKSLNFIEIEFSEIINESSIANNIFISPPLKFDAEWDSDTKLFINFKDSLKVNQTYVVVIGSKVTDLRGNKLSSSFQLAFSTGSKIDKGSISGKIYGIEKNTSYSIFAYELRLPQKNFNKDLPDYISQTGNNNKYEINYLKNGTYRVFAVDDQNNNLLIDTNLEKVGIPYADVSIDSNKLSFKNLNFNPIKIDTTAPRLSYAKPIHNRQVNLIFTEKIVLDSLKQVSIIDSISSDLINILATSENIEDDNILEVFTSPMDSGNVYLCSLSYFSDLSGNISADTTISFTSRVIQNKIR